MWTTAPDGPQLTYVSTCGSAARLLDVLGLEPVAERWSGGAWRRTLQQVRGGAAWRELAYLMLLLVTGVVGCALVVTTWSVGIAFAPWLVYGWALPDGDLRPFSGWQYTLVRLAALLAAPRLARGWPELEVRLARLLDGAQRRLVSLAMNLGAGAGED